MLTIPGAGPDLRSLVYYANINNNYLINNYLEKNLPLSCACQRDAPKQKYQKEQIRSRDT